MRLLVSFAFIKIVHEAKESSFCDSILSKAQRPLDACLLWQIRTGRLVSLSPRTFLAGVSPEITPLCTRIILRQVCWAPRTQQGPISLFCLEKNACFNFWNLRSRHLIVVVVLCSLKLPWSLQILHSPV